MIRTERVSHLGHSPLVVLYWVLLSVAVCTSLLSAEDKNSEQRRMLDLADHLEEHGYHGSARHYYKMISRDPVISVELRTKIKKKIEKSKKTSAKTARTTLPDLDAFIHFDHVTKGVASQVEGSDPLSPREFRSSRINKKKWFVSVLIGVATSYVGYRLHKHFTKPDPPYENTVRVEF